jgi:hypothetical protein
MRGKFRVAAVIWFMGLSCARASESPDTKAAFSIDLQDCLTGHSQTFFTLDFRPDGTVTFDGKVAIREKGVRIARITSHRVQRLRESATRSVSADAPRAETSPHKMRPDFCLKVQVAGSDSSLAGLVSPHDAPGKQLYRQLLRYLDLKSWVCPSQAEAPHAMAQCDRAAINFTYSERENCYRFQHIVSLWRDGQVHYYAHGVPDSDRYYTVEPGIVQRLFKIGSRYQGDLVVTHSRPNRRHRYLIGREMLIEYKRSLSELANVPWQLLPMHGGCESDSAEYPTGALALSR